jgi:outer membrane protein assembly factor BamB
MKRQPSHPITCLPNSIRIALLVIGCCAATSVSFADDWKQFRGPNSTGVSTENKPLPVEFSYETNVLWSAELGRGLASPVIASGRVFETTMLDKQTFAVMAFDAKSGKKLWQKEFPAGKVPEITPPNEHASSTPATDGDRVYVYFSTLGVMAFNAADGKLLWKHPIAMPHYLMGWGPANSPIVFEDLVIFNIDDDLDPFLIALDRYSGDVRWKTPRPEMLGGFSTPVICTAGGRTDLVLAGSGKMKGYDPQTGKELWTCNSLLRTIMTTPVVVDDTIYMSLQSYGDTERVLKFALLQWRDTNQDGKLTKSELEKVFWKKFDKGDKNKDGELVGDEIDAAFQAPSNMAGGGNIIQAIRGGGKGDVTKTHLLWNLDSKAPSNIASPLAYDGRLFVVKKGGISSAFNLKDGSTAWPRMRIRNFGNYYASPIAGDGKIYVTGENGFIVVLKSGPKPEILAKNDMGDSCIATPAISDGRIYIRTLKKLYCIGK